MRARSLFERDTYRHEGALSTKGTEAVSCGVIRELVCRGTSVGLTPCFDGLLAAARAPSCGLRELRLVGCDWPAGRALSELAEALPVKGLKTVAITSMKIGGVLPAALMDKCGEVELLTLSGNQLTGGIPASIGQCTKLKRLLLWGNQLEGCIPEEIGACVALELLQLQKNKLTGGIPACLGQCTKLKRLLLSGNQLEGTVPAAELVKLTALTQLALDENDSLTIGASGEAALKSALPETKMALPKVV